MNKKSYRTLAIIALVFVGIFSISFILFLFNPKLGGGVVAVVTLVSGVVGLALFAIVKIYQNKFKKLDEEAEEMRKANLDENGEEIIGEDAESKIEENSEEIFGDQSDERKEDKTTVNESLKNKEV